MRYLWREVDHESEVLETYVIKRRDRKTALKSFRKLMKRHRYPTVIVTNKLRFYSAAMKVIGNVEKQEVGRWKNIWAENSHLPFRGRERAMLRFRRMRSLKKLVSAHFLFTIISTKNDTFIREIISSLIAPLLSLSGAALFCLSSNGFW